MSRSVAGSYDNEAISIFALIFAFYAYVRALNEGTMFSAVLAALSYFYMAAGWGGYVFITNIVAVHALALLFLQKMTVKQYVTYSVFHIFGTVLCFSIPFINYQALKSSEHVSSHVVFLIVQVILCFS
jgi:dolichyl-diphosphooligosaccharide---protein glycosyltransferase